MAFAVKKGLPFGRGRPKEQLIDERRRSISKATGWIISSSDCPLFPETTATTLTADTLVLARLPVLTEDYTFVEAVINVTAGAAGFVRTGLYTLERDAGGKLQYSLVPASDMSFDTTSTAIVRTNLLDRVTVYTGTRLFLGTIATSATPTMVCAQGNTNNTERCRTLSTSTLPRIVPLAATTASSTTATIPQVSYLSDEARLVL